MASENRSQPQARKQLPAHARPSKPPPLHRSRHSYNHGHHATVSHSRPGGGLTKRHSNTTVPQLVKLKKQEEDDDEDDMASFDQFCATCERQIVTPDSTVLYCSESCRKKDVSKPGHQSIHSPPITPGSLIESTSYFDMPSTDIMPQRSPTVARPPSMAFSELSLTEEEEEGPSEERPAAAFGRRDSEAARYLAQFHDANHPHRTRSNRHSSDNSGLPSLIHSPSSSIGTAASLATSSSRPHLPSRTNPLYSSFHTGTKSIDLVNPFAPDAAAASSLAPSTDSGSLKSGASVRTAFRVVEGEAMSYQKRPSVGPAGQGSGSLKHLFGEAIRGLPKEPVTLRRPGDEEALEVS